MANKGNLGTSPYSKVVLDNTIETAADTPYPVSFINDPTTGLFYKGSGDAALGASGTQVLEWTSSGLTQMIWSTAAGLTATGTTRADALALTALVNFVDTVASGTGVVLPSIATVGVGSEIQIFNAGANVLKVYGAGSDTIDAVAGSTGVSLTNAKRCVYIAKSAATWISAQLGVVSA